MRTSALYIRCAEPIQYSIGTRLFRNANAEMPAGRAHSAGEHLRIYPAITPPAQEYSFYVNGYKECWRKGSMVNTAGEPIANVISYTFFQGEQSCRNAVSVFP
jgi:hypothetical protein